MGLGPRFRTSDGCLVGFLITLLGPTDFNDGSLKYYASFSTELDTLLYTHSFFTWLGRYSGIFSLMTASDNSRPMYSANPGYDAAAMAEVKGEDGAADEGYKEPGTEGCIELDCDDV